MIKNRALWFIAMVLIVILTGCTSTSSPTESIAFSADNGGIELPEGFKAVVVADSVGRARHITADRDGDLYVVLRRKHNGKGIVAIRDADGDGKADRKKYFGDIQGTGIKLYNNYLYVSSDRSVIRYPMKEGELLPSEKPETIVSDFPEQRQHAAKSFTFDNNGNIYVNVGAPSNACQEESRTPQSPGMEPCPQLERQGGIWKFRADVPQQTQQENGQNFATGIRNAVALEWNSATGNLYAVQHGRDQLNTLWPDHFDDEDNAALPAEEFFLIREGDHFGWPHAYYDWKKEEKMVMPEYGGDGEETAPEGKYELPIMAFPGHWAPNDLLFYSSDQFPSSYKNGAFIAFHGSWNRAPEPQQGYKIVFVPFDSKKPSGDYEEFATGFPGMEDPQPQSAKYRPMGLAEGPDGSLYITDSQVGRVWRIMYTGK